MPTCVLGKIHETKVKKQEGEKGKTKTKNTKILAIAKHFVLHTSTIRLHKKTDHA